MLLIEKFVNMANYKGIKIIALVLSFIHILGFFWYLDNYLSQRSLLKFSVLLTGLSLLAILLISDKFLKFVLIRITGIILGAIGILTNTYSMIKDLSLPSSPDIPAVIIRMVVLFLLVILIRRLITP